MRVLHILRDFRGRNLGSPVSESDLYFKCVNRMELGFLGFKPSNCASKDSSGNHRPVLNGYTEATLKRRDFADERPKVRLARDSFSEALYPEPQ